MAIPEKKPYERLSDYLERSLPAELEAGKSRGKATADIIAKFNEEPPKEMFAPFIWGYANSTTGSAASPYGPLTTAFLAATSITDATISTALNDMETSLSSSALTDKLLFLYPLVGGTAATTQYNFIDTSAYNVTWDGSNIFSDDGVQSDGSSFGATGATLTGSLAGYYQTGSFGAYLSGSNLPESPLGAGPVFMNLPDAGNKEVRFHWFNYTVPANSIYADAGYAGDHIRLIYQSPNISTGSFGITVERLAADSYRQSFSSAGTITNQKTEPETDADRVGGIEDEFRLLKRKDGVYWETTPIKTAWLGGDMNQTELNAMTTIVATLNTDLGRAY